MSDNLLVGSFKPWRIRRFVDGRVRSHLVERFWGPSELTIRKWIGSINTSAFVGMNPESSQLLILQCVLSLQMCSCSFLLYAKNRIRCGGDSDRFPIAAQPHRSCQEHRGECEADPQAWVAQEMSRGDMRHWVDWEHLW
jgi:hypothetical protein